LKKHTIKTIITILISISLLTIGIGVGIYYRDTTDKEIKADTIRLIALVNLDEGVYANGERINYAAGLIPHVSDNFVSVSLTEARNGVGEGVFAAYIIIPATFSISAQSINVKPENIMLEYALNPNLDESVRTDVVKDIHDFENILNSNLSYMYISAILKEFHTVQDGADILMKNDIRDMNNIEDVVSQEIMTALEFEVPEELENIIEDIDLSLLYDDNIEIIELKDKIYNDFYENAREGFYLVKDEINLMTDPLNTLSETMSSFDAAYDFSGNLVYESGIINLFQLLTDHNFMLLDDKTNQLDELNKILDEINLLLLIADSLIDGSEESYNEYLEDNETIINAQIEESNEQIENVNVQINDMNIRSDNIRDEIVILESKLSDMESEIDGIKSDLLDLKTAMEAKISAEQASLSTLKSTISTITNSLSAISLSAANNIIDNTVGNIGGSISNIEGELTAIKAELEDAKTSMDVSEICASIDEVIGLIDAISFAGINSALNNNLINELASVSNNIASVSNSLTGLNLDLEGEGLSHEALSDTLKGVIGDIADRLDAISFFQAFASIDEINTEIGTGQIDTVDKKVDQVTLLKIFIDKLSDDNRDEINEALLLSMDNLDLNRFLVIDENEFGDITLDQIIAVIDTHVMNQSDSINADMMLLSDGTLNYLNIIEEYDPYSEFDHQSVYELQSKLSENTYDIQQSTNEKFYEYRTFVFDIENRSFMVDNILSDSLFETYASSSENLSNVLSQLKGNRALIHQENLDLLNSFSGKLGYTRLGSISNTDVYDFIAKPIGMLQINIANSGSFIRRLNVGNELRHLWFIILIVLMTIAAAFILLRTLTNDQSSDSIMEEDDSKKPNNLILHNKRWRNSKGA